MLRGEVEGNPKRNEIGLAERLKLGWLSDREPDLKFDTAWMRYPLPVDGRGVSPGRT